MISRREIFADNIQHNTILKQLLISCIRNENHIHIRINDHILSKHSIIFKASRTLFHPQLITIAICVILRLLMSCSRYFYPIFRYQLLTFPFSFLKIQLTKFCHILCAEKQSPSTFCNAFRTGLPVVFRNAKRLKQSRCQVLCQGFSCTFRHNCRKNIGIQAIVLEFSPRLAIYRCVQKAS